MPKVILLTGGGTAGHLIPVLSVAKKLHEQLPSHKLVYVVERNNPNEHLITDSKLPITVRHIFAGKYRRYHNQKLLSKLFSFKTNILNIRDAFYFVIGLIQSIGLLLRYKPSVLFCKGGYVSAPVGLAASLLRIKFITHDSDSVPGFANRMIGRFATKNAVGVEDVKYPYAANKVVFTGVPVSDEYFKLKNVSLEAAKENIGLSKDSLVLLVGGSTQGAKIIDDNVEKIVPILLKKYPKLIVIQVFGRLNESSLTSRYKLLENELKNRLILKSFLPDFYNYAAAADIIVTRAGATALAAFGVLSKACIVIPAKHLSDGHQVINADRLAKKSAIVLVDEDRAGEELLMRTEYLLQHTNQRISLGVSLNKATPLDSASRIADLIVEVARRV